MKNRVAKDVLYNKQKILFNHKKINIIQKVLIILVREYILKPTATNNNLAYNGFMQNDHISLQF